MSTVGIIPARGGSRRIANKNLAALAGRPLVQYTCEAALDAGVLDAVYVNTDSPAIAQAAARFGVACPTLRPAALAADDTPTRDANFFLLQHLAAHGEHFDTVVVLQPTSPLRSAADIRAALAIHAENAPCAVVSVSPVAPASWVGYVGRDGRFDPLAGDGDVWRLNGAIYIYASEDYIRGHEPARTLAYRMPACRGVDIDTPEDMQHAECLIHGGPASGRSLAISEPVHGRERPEAGPPAAARAAAG